MKRFPEIKKNFGFGLMRLPRIEKDVDIEQTKEMVDKFIEAGFNYFDTAHGYIHGLSELAFKECVAQRYDRSQYLIADKLSPNFFECEEDIRKVFEEELEACGVEYFDFFLMHSQNKAKYAKYKACNAFEVVRQLKAEGKIKHMGISFHDTADVLKMILDEQPDIEFVQIQYNYLDYDDPVVMSRKNNEVLVEYDKPVMVMEPLKGGFLAGLPEDASALLKDFGEASASSYAPRFAASAPNVEVVLSGMSTFEQMEDNLNTFKDFVPVSDEEREALRKVAEILHGAKLISCTNCRYCTEVCPIGMPIPDIFALMNSKLQFHAGWDYDLYRMYEDLTVKTAKASDCLKCANCEGACPQKLEIVKLLEQAVEEMEERKEISF